MLWPVESKYRISSGYGTRIHPITLKESFHGGVDIACPQGTVVLAPCDCVVRRVWKDEQFGGGLSVVVVSTRGPIQFGFAHMSQVDVFVGKQIKRADRVGLSGGTPGTDGAGRSTGPHLHMTVRVKGEKVNPLSVKWHGCPAEEGD